MNAKYLPFLSKADSVIREQADRSKIIAAAIGLAISKELSIPTTAVEIPNSYFSFTNMPVVNLLLSDWNESVVFDLKECVEYARAFWLVSYNATHNVFSNTTLYTEGDEACFFKHLFCIKSIFSDEQDQLLNKNGNAIFLLAYEANKVLVPATVEATS